MEELKELIERSLEEQRKAYKDDPGMTEEDIRLTVYEDIRDTLNILFSDVIY